MTSRNEFTTDGVEPSEMSLMGQRAVHEAAVTRAIFCEVEGTVLDIRKSVTLMTPGSVTVIGADVWDRNEAGVLKAEPNVEVYDGRDLWK